MHGNAKENIMSRETMEWLNTNTLIGLGRTAWHNDEDLRTELDVEDNHYPGFIPADDVRRRLLNWKVAETPVYVPTLGEVADFDVFEMMSLPDQKALRAYAAERLGFEQVPEHKAIRHGREGTVFAMPTTSYAVHDADEYLLRKLEQVIYDSNLASGDYDGEQVGISSAGLLKRGAVAWVQVELPDWVVSREAGIKLTPRLLASTSLDRSMATSYKLVNGIVVCDNTLEAASFEKTKAVRFRHSKNSLVRLEDVRARLGLTLRESAESVGEQIDRLYRLPVSTVQWERFLDEFTSPDAEADSTQGAKAQATRMDNKRETMQKLWIRDPRVSPWSRTAWGVVQAVNTFNTWERSVKGATRPERNMLNVIKGEQAKDDAATLALLEKVGVLA